MDNTLDITTYKLTGMELRQKIIDDLKLWATWIWRPYPDTITMTSTQFDELCPDQDGRMKPEEYLYRTPIAVMEVRVKDPQNLVNVIS